MSAVDKLRNNGIELNLSELEAIAVRFNITRVSVFGSSIRQGSTRPNDVDLLVTFDPLATVSLFDLMDLEAELSRVFALPVDIVEPEALTNPIRRRNILSSIELLYAA